jgi:ketosteroid isomerase-like protein
MSQENVERFVAIAEAFNQIAQAPDDPFPHLQGLLGAMDSTIQFHPQQAVLEGGYAGHEGVMQWLVDIAEHYRDGHIRVAEVRDLQDRVLALGTLHFTARASGIETEAPLGVVASFHDGLITQFTDYGDHTQAIEAAGLSE